MSPFDPNAAALPDSGIFGLPTPPEQARVLLLPVPFDATTSYRHGAAEGPRAILAASRQIDLHDVETGDPYEAGICMVPPSAEVVGWNAEARAAAEPVLRRGGQIGDDPDLLRGLARVNQLGEEVARLVHDFTAAQLLPAPSAQAPRHPRYPKIVGVVGGDHSVPLGAIAAYGARYPGLGILHVDAHADLRQAYEGFVHSHASIMANVAERVPGVSRIVQVGVRDLCEEEAARIRDSRGRIVAHYDADLWQARFDGEPWSRICERIVDGLPQEVYVSFDIDGLDPALCPHTGTPVPGGLGFPEATALLRSLVRSHRRIVGFDLTEVAPGPDQKDEWDANVGARLLYKLIGYALLSNP